MKPGWHQIPFEEAFSEESAGNIKTPQSEFLPHGRFPVVDQGKDLIAGYVNDETRLCKAPLPAIVFGDHTRCIKFIDFPFCMGADGTKILRPRVEADAKYLYHYLRQLRLANAGYDRHFKYLKRTEVLLPTLPEQHRIATILDKAEALRHKRRQALAKLDTLTQSLFLDLFGDPVRNDKNWRRVHLLDRCRNITDGTHDTPDRVASGIPFITSKNIRPFEFDLSNLDFVTIETHREIIRRCNPQRGDVLYTNIGVNVGNAVVNRLDFDFSLKNVALIQPDFEKLDSLFLEALLNHNRFKEAILRTSSVGGAQKFVSLTILRGFEIILPPISLQRSFAAQVEAAHRIKKSQQTSLSKLGALFASLQHRAFHGEL